MATTTISSLSEITSVDDDAVVACDQSGATKKAKKENLQASVLHVQDQKASGTDGGNFSAGGFFTRDLNTVLTNEINGASLSANQITLPAGTYWIEASAPAFKVKQHQTLLRNMTDSSNVLIGTSELALQNDSLSASQGNTGDQSRSIVSGQFTIASSKTFELQHQCNLTNTGGDGRGVAANFGVTEVYSDVKIWRVGS